MEDLQFVFDNCCSRAEFKPLLAKLVLQHMGFLARGMYT
jgi:hypothetical protein